MLDEENVSGWELIGSSEDNFRNESYMYNTDSSSSFKLVLQFSLILPTAVSFVQNTLKLSINTQCTYLHIFMYQHINS